MIKQIPADEKTLQPLKLDRKQIEELEQLIDSLKKEILYPGKSAEKAVPEEPKKDGKSDRVFSIRGLKDT